MIVAQAAFVAPTASVSLGYSSADVVDPDFARGASTLGDAVMFGGYALAGVAVIAASASFATRWLRIVGYVLGAFSVAAMLTFFPALALPLWEWWQLSGWRSRRGLLRPPRLRPPGHSQVG